MEILTEDAAKDIAMTQAKVNGHDMRPWRRMRSARHNILSTCRRCGKEMRVLSTIFEKDEAERMKAAGIVIGRFQNGLHDVDFTYVASYVTSPCSRR